MLATPTPRTAKGLNPTLIRQPPATYMRGQEFEMREPVSFLFFLLESGGFQRFRNFSCFHISCFGYLCPSTPPPPLHSTRAPPSFLYTFTLPLPLLLFPKSYKKKLIPSPPQTQQPTMHMTPTLSRTISHDSHHSQDTQYSHANVGTRANIGSVPVHQRGGRGGNGGLCCGICAGLACFECLECCC